MEVGSGNYKKQSPTKKNLAINDAVDFVLVCDTHYSLVNASSQRDERALARIHATNSNQPLTCDCSPLQEFGVASCITALTPLTRETREI
jgi:hypothetical protein